MAVTKTEARICALKELLMARQAFHRAFNEFTRTLPIKMRDDRVVHMIQRLPDIDPRETDEQTVEQVLILAYGPPVAAKVVALAA